MVQSIEYGRAGDLLKEVQEMQKVIPVKETVENRSSTTVGCGALLSIWCC